MKKMFLVLAALFAPLLLCGCSLTDVDELYSLPQPQEEYLQLQALIDAEITGGSEYSAPTAGSQRQSVQLTDIDGDGANEALAFLKNSSSVPVICVYRVESGQYVPAVTITGEGTGIGRVEYSDLDGDGVSEIIVSWKISTDIVTMRAYSVRNWSSSVLLTASCADFLIGNLSGGENPEVLALCFSDDGGVVESYSTDRAGEQIRSSAKLSAALTYADRFRFASISGGTPAIFVEGHYQRDDQEWYLTDVIIASEGKLVNVTMNNDTGNSSTRRSTAVYSQDIDNDGVMEIPISTSLFKQPRVEAEYYVFDWYDYDAYGRRSLSASTYHCYSDGWYYVIPQQWRDSLTIRRETGKSGERTIVLSTVDGDTEAFTDRLTIYTLSDENRRDRARLQGRFILISGETVIYAAKLHSDDNAPATEDEKNDVISRFRLIYSEWMPGAV